ncbi:MAG: NADPH-dependent F420 reductase [Burkholderiales bacterium]|jgi:NADPH-dependent F420 reductase|nr:NADPH-dependent F420 reductase [Burkholderiales bacterium]
MTLPTSTTIAVLGGTGHEGAGIAARLALGGHAVVIGSRDAQRAADKAAELNTLTQTTNLRGASLAEAAAAGDIVILAVPFSAQQATALALKAALAGKILIDVTVPLVPPKVSVAQLPGGQSCVKQLQEQLGADVRVVSAFQNVSAHALLDLDHAVDCDVLVCADDADARRAVAGLIRGIGMSAVEAGALANSVVAEALTSVLIWLNRNYKVPDSGIRITGLPPQAS